MKKALLFLLTALTLTGCGRGNQGELIGVKQKKFYETKPHGMALIPGGSLIMGSSDEDILAANDNITRTVTLRSFWMDETEITNAEYQQFVEWVKDSIIRTELAKAALLNGGYFSVSEFPTSDEEIDANPILSYLPQYDMDDLQDGNDDEKSGYQQYLEENFSDYVSNYYETEDAPDEVFHYHLPLNRDVDIVKEREEYPDVDYARVFEETIYLPENEWFNGEPALNTKLLKYRFASVDLNQAVNNPDSARSNFTRYEVHEVYPDTTVWIKDFNYSYNEPMHNDYFWHRAYANYPVVGINWHQARAFAHWRSKIRNDYLRSRKKRKSTTGRFRLPTEVEWEYAARANQSYKYSGSDNVGEVAWYDDNSGSETHPVGQKKPNGFGLYDMSGNVYEWCWDWKGDYSSGSQTDPTGPDSGSVRVDRGGCWGNRAGYTRVSDRSSDVPAFRRGYLGFRLSRLTP